jgi:hypothetical protein
MKQYLHLQSSKNMAKGFNVTLLKLCQKKEGFQSAQGLGLTKWEIPS